MPANWSRRFVNPIYLKDGTVLRTLKQAAVRLLKSPKDAATQAAAERIMEAAQNQGDIMLTEAAVRLALFQHVDKMSR